MWGFSWEGFPGEGIFGNHSWRTWKTGKVTRATQLRGRTLETAAERCGWRRRRTNTKRRQCWPGKLEESSASWTCATWNEAYRTWSWRGYILFASKQQNTQTARKLDYFSCNCIIICTVSYRIALSYRIVSYYIISFYYDLEIWIRGHSRSLKLVPFESSSGVTPLKFSNGDL